MGKGKLWPLKKHEMQDVHSNALLLHKATFMYLYVASAHILLYFLNCKSILRNLIPEIEASIHESFILHSAISWGPRELISRGKLKDVSLRFHA